MGWDGNFNTTQFFFFSLWSQYRDDSIPDLKDILDDSTQPVQENVAKLMAEQVRYVQYFTIDPGGYKKKYTLSWMVNNIILIAH